MGEIDKTLALLKEDGKKVETISVVGYSLGGRQFIIIPLSSCLLNRPEL